MRVPHVWKLSHDAGGSLDPEENVRLEDPMHSF